jgi:hypothetical protein
VAINNDFDSDMEKCKCSETVRHNWGISAKREGLICLFCNKLIESDESAPQPSEDSSVGNSAVGKSTSGKSAAKAPSKKGPATLDDILAAQNRTTHAVRAFVRFLFIQLSAITAGAVVLNFANEAATTYECIEYGNCGASDGLSVVAVIIIIAGVVISSSVGWSELHKSDIPD